MFALVILNINETTICCMVTRLPWHATGNASIDSCLGPCMILHSKQLAWDYWLKFISDWLSVAW